MIKAQIEKGKQAVVEARGSFPELVNDIAILVGSIYGQFQAAHPDTAQLFRMAVIGTFVDPQSAVWKPIEGQEGVIFPVSEE